MPVAAAGLLRTCRHSHLVPLALAAEFAEDRRMPAMPRTICARGLWAICVVFAVYTAWAGLFVGTIPDGIDGLIGTVLLIVFALIHGAQRYGWSSIIVFVVICLVISNALENLSIVTGFPFGRYYYTDVLGPKLFHVPVLIGAAYAGAGYLSWIVAHVLLDRLGPTDRIAAWALPMVGAVLMVAWDLSFDPTASTIGGLWIWIDGGGFFGVPLQNFIGWYLTVFLFLALFSWFQSARPVLQSQSRSFWAQAIIMYFLLGVRYPLIYARSTDSREITDPGGYVWNTGDIRATAALIATVTMIAFALIACFRLRDRIKGGGLSS